MNASSLGYKIIVDTLINDHGADAVGRDGDESTALMMAARNGHIDVVNILFEKRSARFCKLFKQGWIFSTYVCCF